MTDARDAEIAALRTEVERLRNLLREHAQEALEDVSDWACYVTPYFQNKYDLAADLEKWQRRASSALEPKP